MLEFLVLVLVLKVVAPLLHAYGMKWIEKHFDEDEDQFAVLEHVVSRGSVKKDLKDWYSLGSLLYVTNFLYFVVMLIIAYYKINCQNRGIIG